MTNTQNSNISLEELVFGMRMVAKDGKVVVGAGGGCLSVFGAFFFLIGCGVIVIGLQEVKGETWFILPFAGLFALTGFVLIICRYRLQIDASTRTYQKGISLLINITTQRGSLDEFEEVVLMRKVARSGQNPDKVSTQRAVTMNVIQLSGPQGSLDLVSRGDASLARRAGKRVAKELGLPFSERSGE